MLMANGLGSEKPAEDRSGDQAADIPAVARLEGAQGVAMRALMAGKSFTEAAAEAGVDRGTLYRWRTENLDFIDAMTDWRLEAHSHARDRMLAIADVAIESVQSGVASGDARLAFRLLLDLHKSHDKLETSEKSRIQEQRRRLSDPLQARLHEATQKMTHDQFQRMPELLEEIIEIDNARRKAAIAATVQALRDSKTKADAPPDAADGAR